MSVQNYLKITICWIRRRNELERKVARCKVGTSWQFWRWAVWPVEIRMSRERFPRSTRNLAPSSQQFGTKPDFNLVWINAFSIGQINSMLSKQNKLWDCREAQIFQRIRDSLWLIRSSFGWGWAPFLRTRKSPDSPWLLVGWTTSEVNFYIEVLVTKANKRYFKYLIKIFNQNYLLSDDTEHFKLDSVELIETSPRTAAGKSLEELSHGYEIQSIRTIEHHALKIIVISQTTTTNYLVITYYMNYFNLNPIFSVITCTASAFARSLVVSVLPVPAGPSGAPPRWR